MTDYAYHLALAMAEVAAGNATDHALVAELAAMLDDDPDMSAFFAAASAAVPRLRALRSGLPEDTVPCFDPEVRALVDDNNDAIPDWQNLFTLAEQPMSFLIFPVTPNYANKNGECEIDKLYKPIGSTHVPERPARSIAQAPRARRRRVAAQGAAQG